MSATGTGEALRLGKASKVPPKFIPVFEAKVIFSSVRNRDFYS
jgi:hypothetical protein